jgi:hypothetical protein
MNIDDYIRKYNRPQDNNFAVACYNMNSIQELEEALSEEPDATDMKNWNIGPTEWRDAITAALNERREGE